MPSSRESGAGHRIRLLACFAHRLCDGCIGQNPFKSRLVLIRHGVIGRDDGDEECETQEENPGCRPRIHAGPPSDQTLPAGMLGTLHLTANSVKHEGTQETRYWPGRVLEADGASLDRDRSPSTRMDPGRRCFATLRHLKPKVGSK